MKKAPDDWGVKRDGCSGHWLWPFLGVVVAFALILALSYVQSARAHDWYGDLKQPGTGYSCCNGEDCRPTRAYRDADGIWHAWVNGKEVTVPRHLVLEKVAPDGNSHICASKSGTIYCFVGGVPKS